MFFCIFFFKQKTAYEMRISDWSSDVCSSDLEILFLDEPTAGVDVELRRDMWAMVRSLRDRGVTIILTTHYIEEAEEMADRVGVISKGKLILVEEKQALIKIGRARVGKECVSTCRSRWSP